MSWPTCGPPHPVLPLALTKVGDRHLQTFVHSCSLVSDLDAQMMLQPTVCQTVRSKEGHTLRPDTARLAARCWWPDSPLFSRSSRRPAARASSVGTCLAAHNGSSTSVCYSRRQVTQCDSTSYRTIEACCCREWHLIAPAVAQRRLLTPRQHSESGPSCWHADSADSPSRPADDRHQPPLSTSSLVTQERQARSTEQLMPPAGSNKHLSTTTQRLGSARRVKEELAAGQKHSRLHRGT